MDSGLRQDNLGLSMVSIWRDPLCWPGLKSVCGNGPKPALIDENLERSSEESDCHIRRLPYWPTYWGATLQARSSFLNWLATGRKDPSADLGYVFLYFYGLERRALYDTKTSPKARTELPAIVAEVEQLLQIYSGERVIPILRGFVA